MRYQSGLALDSYLDSSHQGAVPRMVPSRVAGGLAQSSSSSGIFFQGDVQSQAVVNSRLSSSYGNSANSVPGTGRPNLGPVSGDMNNVVLNGVANSGPSVGASSLVTDANSAALSGAPHMQRSASFNTESYMRLPASPMSFTSNNISLSGSSVVDGSTVGQQQGSHQDLTHMQQSQLQQGGSGATSLPNSQAGQVSLQMGPRVPGYMQDPNSLSQVQKKPRLDIKQEDVMQQQVLQQLLQRQDSMQLQGRNPQLHALFQQQQRMRQQQQFLQALPQLQRAQLQQQQQQAQIRQQMQQQGMQQVMKRPSDNGVCARRLMQYLYHQRQRPTDNTIAYWRKFVAEYYSPRAKKRWCLSMYDNVGHNAPGVFPQASVDVWQCDICSAKSGRGFEATFEVLPRLNEIKFGSGVIDELLFLDMPRESRLSSGAMVLEYCKAVQETVYEQLRVVREGLLRIIFTQDLKILSWEFCARRHEELYPRRLVAPQVNQLLQVAQKCQSTISESGSEGVSEQDLQTNSNMVLTAGRQLVKSLELQSLNDLGFSKRYVRCLQIAEVVNSMKDLIDFCRDRKVGPIEGLKTYPRHPTAAKLQLQKMQEMEQLASVQGLPTDRNTLNKLMVLQSGINNPMSNNHHLVSRGGALSGSPQAALAISNYQNMLMRQNSMSQNANVLHQEVASSSFTNSIQSPSRSFQGSASLLSPSPSLSVQQQQPQQQQQQLQQQLLQRSLSGNNNMIQQPQQQLQQQMLQQLLQEMSSNNSGGQQNVRNNGGGGFGTNNSSAQQPATPSNVSGNAAAAPSRSNSFKSAAAASNADSSAAAAAAATNQKATDPPQNHLHLQDELPDISQEFMDNGFFNSDLDGFSWKA